MSRWAGGFGVGGFFIGSLVVIVLGYFVVAAFGSHKTEVSACQQSDDLVRQLDSIQRHHRSSALGPAVVRQLHLIGSRLTPIADRAIGAPADALDDLATLATAAQVGHHLDAQSALAHMHAACWPGR